jgi:AcrR family transcriptional regulator
MYISGVRDAQRRRTRKAIVDAAMKLLAEDETPSVADVAEAADVSRRTVYLYFPTFEQLLLDATLGLIAESALDETIAAGDDEDPEARVERVVRTLQQSAAETERLGRSLIRLTVDSDGSEPGVPTRGYRRVQWLEEALAPVRDRLDEPAFERLVSALSLLVGWEPLVVLGDVRGLDATGAEEVSAWAALALLRAALDDAGQDAL